MYTAPHRARRPTVAVSVCLFYFPRRAQQSLAGNSNIYLGLRILQRAAEEGSAEQKTERATSQKTERARSQAHDLPRPRVKSCSKEQCNHATRHATGQAPPPKV